MTRSLPDRPVPRRGAYGIDAPYLLLLPIAWMLICLVQGVVTGRVGPFVGAALVGLCGAFGLHASRRGKFVVWSEVLDTLSLRGDERVLDVGCGRGAVLLMAARRLTTGRAVGVDLWRRWDQSGNAAEVTARNAVAEGVGDKVTLETGDMTALPFAPGAFDLIVSSLAIHNVSGRASRDRAIDQIVAVLKPGGRVAIADLRATGQYRDRLLALGMRDVAVRNLGWRMWWSGPWMPTRLVTATKPT